MRLTITHNTIQFICTENSGSRVKQCENFKKKLLKFAQNKTSGFDGCLSP